MPFEQTLLGQVVLLFAGVVVGLVMGRGVPSGLWLIPTGALPWLGFTATQIFC